MLRCRTKFSSDSTRFMQFNGHLKISRCCIPSSKPSFKPSSQSSTSKFYTLTVIFFCFILASRRDSSVDAVQGLWGDGIPTDRWFFKFPFGHYTQSKAYETDQPHSTQTNDDNHRGQKDEIPYGLPAGGYAMSGVGPPYGLVSYLLDMGLTKMWAKYNVDNGVYLNNDQKYFGKPFTEYYGLSVPSYAGQRAEEDHYQSSHDPNYSYSQSHHSKLSHTRKEPQILPYAHSPPPVYSSGQTTGYRLPNSDYTNRPSMPMYSAAPVYSPLAYRRVSYLNSMPYKSPITPKPPPPPPPPRPPPPSVSYSSGHPLAYSSGPSPVYSSPTQTVFNNLPPVGFNNMGQYSVYPNRVDHFYYWK